MINLELPTLAVLTWIVWRLSLVEKDVRKINDVLNIPVQSLIENIKDGKLTLSEQAKEKEMDI